MEHFILKVTTPKSDRIVGVFSSLDEAQKIQNKIGQQVFLPERKSQYHRIKTPLPYDTIIVSSLIEVWEDNFFLRTESKQFLVDKKVNLT